MTTGLTGFEHRPIEAELDDRWRDTGAWSDAIASEQLWNAVDRCERLPVCVWSQVRPYEGTIGDIAAKARRFAGNLRSWGVGPGDVVVTQLPNWAEAIIALWGSFMAGVVLAPVVHIYGPSEVSFILRETAARVLITADQFGSHDYLEAIPTFSRDLPALEHVIVVGDRTLPADAVAFDRSFEHDPITGPTRVKPEDPVVMGFTSGTTSTPKAVVQTHRGLFAELRHERAFDSSTPHPPPLQGSPVSHITGMLTLFSPLTTGGPIHLIDKWDPDRVLALIEDQDLSAPGGATFFLTSLLDAASFDQRFIPRLRHTALGGSSIPAAVVDRCASLGIELIRAYGSTEHPSVTGGAYADPDPRRSSTDGRALEQVDIRVVDGDGQDVPAGRAGELLTRGPDLFAGYLERAQTEAAFDDGWFKTGDVGIVDADGYLTITDRVKDIIIRGGENLSAAEIEEVLCRVPGVAECAVVAAPDARLGEHVCAFVRPTTSGEPPDADRIRDAFAAAGIARQKWPEEVRYVDDFDRTPSGKVKKFVLRELARQAS